jgi:hypothetical protein
MKISKTRIGLAAVAVVAGAVAFAVSQLPASASTQPFLNPGNGHAKLDNGKAVAHASGGSEVTFDDMRDEMSGGMGTADLPPDASVSALGCANRGSATNPRMNQDCTLRRQAEEQVAVNPTDPNNVVAGQNDSRIGYNKCGFDYSLDNGATWGDGQPPFFQVWSTLGHTYDAASDPALTFDGTGRAWYSCVLFDVNTNASGLAVTPSTAGLKGSAYSNVAPTGSPYVVAQDSTGHHFFDKEFIAGDQRSGQTSVYVTFTDFQVDTKCSRSNNKSGQCQSPIYISKWNGAHWTTPVQISGQGSFCTGGDAFNNQLPANACNNDQGSMPVVLPNGDVYVVFNNFNTPTLVNQQLGVHVTVSGDTLTPQPPVMVGIDDESKLALCDFGRGGEQCVDSLNIRSQDFPAVALDPTSSGSHLVATWTDTRQSVGNGNYDIVVSESTDGGATWTDSTGGGTVLTTAGGAYFEPSITVASNGKPVVSAYHANTALHGAAKGDGTFGYGYFVKSSGSFSAYTNASDSQTNPSPQTNPTQAGFLGDYSSIAAAPSGGTVYMVWSDTRNSSAQGPDEDVFVFKKTVS